MQAAHSALEAGRELGSPNSNSFLILLEAKNQDQLIKISETLKQHGIRFHMFYEPDYDRGYTSLTTEPLYTTENRKLFSKYKLYKFRPERAFSTKDEVHFN